MPLYQGKIGLNKSDHDRNEEIIRKINQPNQSRQASLLAAALTCFTVCAVIIGYIVWR